MNHNRSTALEWSVKITGGLKPVYISQLIRFARVSSHVADFNARNKSLTAKLLQQGYRYHIFERLSPNFIADTMNWFLNSMLD